VEEYGVSGVEWLGAIKGIRVRRGERKEERRERI
jgi:hypothetical protein